MARMRARPADEALPAAAVACECAPMPDREIEALVENFAAGPALVREAVRGLDAGALSRRHGGWSVRDILHHLVDAELVRAVRIRQVLAEERPAILPWDEGLWQRRLQYLWRSPEAALASFEQVVYGTAEILSRVERAGWERAGVHPEKGEYSVRALVEAGVTHHAEHCAQIAATRGPG
jgi:hypothetical protein